jgi:DNA polymerase-1
MELRLLAHLSGDPVLINAFLNEEDIHATTAAALFNISPKEISKDQRSQAKAVNFGIIYGQGAYGLSRELGIEVKEASAYIERYFKQHGKVQEYLENAKAEARRTGKAVTFTGRERLIPEITGKNPQMRQLAERLALNTPIQGAGADIIKMAMLAIDAAAAKEGLSGFMILQIHDELIFEVPDAEIEKWKPLVQGAMENVFQLKVPLTVNIALGKNWKEC